MKQAYLIIAHNNFRHLEKLINFLDCGDVFLYLCIDAKATIPDFIYNIECVNPLVIIHERLINWGDQSFTLAELDLFSKAFENTEIEWFHLISGSDFPLKSIEELNLFFESAKDVDCFMETEPLPRHLTGRMELFHFIVRRPSPGNSILKYINSKLPALQLRLGIKRHHPEKLPFMYGSNWVDIRRNAVKLLLDKQRDIIKYTKYTSCSDEIYKQTFLQNSGLHIVNDNLRYIDWSARQPSPKSLAFEDFDDIIASGKLFAGKFASTESIALRNRIVEYLKIATSKK